MNLMNEADRIAHSLSTLVDGQTCVKAGEHRVKGLHRIILRRVCAKLRISGDTPPGPKRHLVKGEGPLGYHLMHLEPAFLDKEVAERLAQHLRGQHLLFAPLVVVQQHLQQPVSKLLSFSCVI